MHSVSSRNPFRALAAPRCLYYNRTGNSAFCNKTTTRYVLMSAFRESRSDKRSGTVYRPDPRSHFSPISPISRLSSRRGRLFLGFLFSSCIGLLAYRRRSLTRDGAAVAVVTGTTIFGLGGWPWGLSLIYFFLSSTLLSHFREKEKEHMAADKFSKGAQRDLAQVAANGGLAALWATALGVLSHAEPRLITSGRTVAPGTSGGITLPGLVASALGACTFGLVLWATQGLHKSRADLPAISLLSGQAGSLCDSLLGATV